MANPSAALGDATRFAELRQRLLFLIGALIVYRIGTFIPVPGIDPLRSAQFFRGAVPARSWRCSTCSPAARCKRLAFSRSASCPISPRPSSCRWWRSSIPQLKQLRKEGESGRRKITQYTRYGTVGLALVQSIGAAIALQNQGAGDQPGLQLPVHRGDHAGDGHMFLMWLGEQITERGIGNGISMIILSSIISGLPAAIGGTLELVNTGEMNPAIALILFVLVVGRDRLRGVHGARPAAHHGQLRQAPAGAPRVCRASPATCRSRSTCRASFPRSSPPASSCSRRPSPAGSARNEGFGWLQDMAATPVARASRSTCCCMPALIMFFCFFYTALVFNSRETADNLKKCGRVHPRNPARPADGRLHRQGADPADVLGWHLRHGRMPAAGIHDSLLERAVLLRRHVTADHRGRDHGFHGPAAGAHDVSSVREPAEEGQSSAAMGGRVSSARR